MARKALAVWMWLWAAFVAWTCSALMLTPTLNRRQGSVFLRLSTTDEASSAQVPKPNIITPTTGSPNNKDKFLMMYTCKLCQGRNANMISKVAYNFGMVVATCRHCKKKHLIADNQGKLDMGEYGKKIEEYLISQGEDVQKLSVTAADLENNYLVDNNGKLELLSKLGGQPDINQTIVDIPAQSIPRPKGFGKEGKE